MQKNSKEQPAIFYGLEGTFLADTCEPLKQAKKRGELHHDAFARGCYPGKEMPPDMMPEVCVACVWDAKNDQNWGLPMHRNEGIELGYLTRGKLDFTIDNNTHHLTSGDMTVTRPWQPHQVGSPNVTASRMHWLIIDVGTRRPNDTWKWPEWLSFAPQDLARLTELLRYNEQATWRGNKKIEDCFESIAKYVESTDKPETVQTRIQLYINELLLEVLELLQGENIRLDSNLASTTRSVEMFLKALPKHIDYPWTLETMAKHCDLGRSRFSHYCKNVTNMSPADYLANCRIKKAKKLLVKAKQSNITEIAFACGFESSQYFATVFKRITGLTPSQYKAEATK